MWVQWTGIGASVLKKHFFNFWQVNFLIKSLKALLNIKEQLNKKNSYLILFPFSKSNP
jgi:hypothetical protein